MNRSEFLQSLIIAPIAGFFGIKAVAKDEDKEAICTEWHSPIYCKSKTIILANPDKKAVIKSKNSIHVGLRVEFGSIQELTIHENKTLLYEFHGIEYMPDFITKPNTKYTFKVKPRGHQYCIKISTYEFD